jgi:hypothetical protein
VETSDVLSSSTEGPARAVPRGHANPPEPNPYGAEDIQDPPAANGRLLGPRPHRQRHTPAAARGDRPPYQDPRPIERYVNGILVPPGRRGAPRQTVRPTQGLTLEGFLHRCRIEPNDYHTRSILQEHRIVDWPFFLLANEADLLRLGLTIGATRALCQGGLSLRRRAARPPAAPNAAA